MRIAYLECFSGISGDMFLGALVDAGVPVSVLEQAVAALGVGAELRIVKVDRSGITATKVDVVVAGEADQPRELAGIAVGGDGENLKAQRARGAAAVDAETLARRHAEVWPPTEAARSAAHAHEHHHFDEHRHEHAEQHAHGHVHGRHLSEIKRIISAAQISDSVKTKAIAMFEALGAAEAKIHNMDIERVHFHEVGAVDAMVDIVGAAVGAEALGVDEIICSPLNVGGGTVKCAHGVFPVPAPATVELLQGAPVYSSGVQAELVTPTGAAIVKILAARFAEFPPIKVERAGYGAGSRDFSGHANVLRLVIGEALEKTTGNRCSTSPDSTDEIAQDTVAVLEANLDDLNPQVFGYVVERLLAEGALDVFGVPVQMKKNRPGMVLTILAKPADAENLTKIVFAETSTLGVRRRDEQRQILGRQWETVTTQWGEVRMKIASLNGTVTNFAPEYEDCRRIAEEKHIPLKNVMQAATQAYLAGEKKH
jgi:uncharacterized protein (TIGR00299 family) protein